MTEGPAAVVPELTISRGLSWLLDVAGRGQVNDRTVTARASSAGSRLLGLSDMQHRVWYYCHMGEIDLPRWTPELVMAVLRAAMRRPVLHRPPWLPEAPEEKLPGPDLVALTEGYLGRQSLERLAMLILAKPRAELSIREMCRERIRWHRSRTSLYRQARRGARIVAQRLNADHVAPPPQYAGPAHP